MRTKRTRRASERSEEEAESAMGIVVRIFGIHILCIISLTGGGILWSCWIRLEMRVDERGDRRQVGTRTSCCTTSSAERMSCSCTVTPIREIMARRCWSRLRRRWWWWLGWLRRRFGCRSGCCRSCRQRREETIVTHGLIFNGFWRLTCGGRCTRGFGGRLSCGRRRGDGRGPIGLWIEARIRPRIEV